MSLKKNTAYSILINVLNVAVPIITVPYTSRVFGVENTGIVNFAMTYAAYFSLFIMLGIPLYGIREIGKNRDNTQERSRIVSELFRITLITTSIFASLYVISIFSIDSLRENWEFLLVAGSSTILAPFNADWYFTGRENLRVIALRSIIIKVLGLIVLFTFVRQREDMLLFLVLNAIIGVGSQLWTFVYMLRTEVTLMWRNLNIKRHLKPVTILFLSSLAVSIYTMLDTLMLGFLSSYAEVGYYSSAIKISKLLLPVVTAAAAATIPSISALYKERKFEELNEVSQKSFNFMSFLAPPLTFGLMAITPVFVPWFFGAEFLGAITPMIIVSGVILFIGLNNFYGVQILVSTSKDKQFTYAVIIGTATNFILNLFLIPHYGAIGASVATIIAEFGVVVSTFYFAMKYVKEIRPSYKTLIHSIVASLPMFVYGYFIPKFVDSNSISFFYIMALSVVTFFVIEIFIFRDKVVYWMVNKILRR